jgi:hypothetical protein
MLLGKSKVHQDRDVIVGHNNVGRLDVIVGDTALVEISDGTGKGTEVGASTLNGDLDLDQMGVERHDDSGCEFIHTTLELTVHSPE